MLMNIKNSFFIKTWGIIVGMLVSTILSAAAASTSEGRREFSWIKPDEYTPIEQDVQLEFTMVGQDGKLDHKTRVVNKTRLQNVLELYGTRIDHEKLTIEIKVDPNHLSVDLKTIVELVMKTLELASPSTEEDNGSENSYYDSSDNEWEDSEEFDDEDSLKPAEFYGAIEMIVSGKLILSDEGEELLIENLGGYGLLGKYQNEICKLTSVPVHYGDFYLRLLQWMVTEFGCHVKTGDNDTYMYISNNLNDLATYIPSDGASAPSDIKYSNIKCVIFLNDYKLPESSELNEIPQGKYIKNFLFVLKFVLDMTGCIYTLPDIIRLNQGDLRLPAELESLMSFKNKTLIGINTPISGFGKINSDPFLKRIFDECSENIKYMKLEISGDTTVEFMEHIAKLKNIIKYSIKWTDSKPEIFEFMDEHDEKMTYSEKLKFGFRRKIVDLEVSSSNVTVKELVYLKNCVNLRRIALNNMDRVDEDIKLVDRGPGCDTIINMLIQYSNAKQEMDLIVEAQNYKLEKNLSDAMGMTNRIAIVVLSYRSVEDFEQVKELFKREKDKQTLKELIIVVKNNDIFNERAQFFDMLQNKTKLIRRDLEYRIDRLRKEKKTAQEYLEKNRGESSQDYIEASMKHIESLSAEIQKLSQEKPKTIKVTLRVGKEFNDFEQLQSFIQCTPVAGFEVKLTFAKEASIPDEIRDALEDAAKRNPRMAAEFE